MQHLRNHLMVIGAALMLVACSRFEPAPVQGPAPAWAAHVSYKGQWLNVDDVQHWYNPEKGLKVTGTVTSNARFDMTIAYRVLWLTEDGQPIHTVLGKWQDRRVMPGQTITLTQIGPGPRAKDYRLEIIEK